MKIKFLEALQVYRAASQAVPIVTNENIHIFQFVWDSIISVLWKIDSTQVSRKSGKKLTVTAWNC